MPPTLPMEAGKWSHTPLVMLNAAGGPATLLELVDPCSGQIFLVDTGAKVSVIPLPTVSPPDLLSPDSSAALRMANGCTSCTLHFGDHHFTASLLIADVQPPLLGSDFLHVHGPLVDLACDCLLPGLLDSIPCRCSTHHSRTLHGEF